MILTLFSRLSCTALLCLPLTVTGASYTYLDVIVKGEINAAPCKINEGENILVNFQEVVTSYIDNDNYSEKLDYRIECQDNKARAIKMYISGTASAVDNRYLSTSVDDLAVKFHADNTLMPLNDKITVQYPVQPELRVVLAKKAGSKLPAGNFTANATIHIEYE